MATPVSYIQNKWADAQRVDSTDLNVEQEFTNNTLGSIISNNIGNGVIPSKTNPRIIFDSDQLTASQQYLLNSNKFDGYSLEPHLQPSDINYGNQIAIELSGSNVSGRISSKVAIIGLSFDDQLIQEKFYFYRNEIQITSKHFKRILVILFNDFFGNSNGSRYTGGKFLLREAKALEISRDAKMVSQDVMPDLFYRDFNVAQSGESIWTTIQNGLGASYNADDLNINITRKDPLRTLTTTTSIIGQKFLAKTDNIQKITLLLGVSEDTSAPIDQKFDWSGNIIVSIYPLQSQVTCPSDIIPELAIDYDPTAIPLAEISFSQNELRDAGYVLSNVAQPIDFVYSNSSIASAGGIDVGNYYIITIKRSGSTAVGVIFAESGNHSVDDSRMSLFNGNWVDVSDEDLWYQIWTNAIKIADGQAYDAGKGIMYEKTIVDSSGVTIDFENTGHSFADSSTTNYAIIQASIQEEYEAQDERTGNTIYPRKQYVPTFSFVDESGLSTLKDTTDPIIIGGAVDSNFKDASIINGTITLPGQVVGDRIVIINPDADLLTARLVGKVFIPNTSSSNKYLISKVTYCVDGYGDVNGDGVIDSDDIAEVTALDGYDLSNATTQALLESGVIDLLKFKRADVNGDGIIGASDINAITNYVNRTSNSFVAGSSFTHLEIELQPLVGRYDGYFDYATCIGLSCNTQISTDGPYGINVVNIGDLAPEYIEYDGYVYSPNLGADDSAWVTVPFVSKNYSIISKPFWHESLVNIESCVRYVSAVFLSETVDQNTCGNITPFECEQRDVINVTCEPGRNEYYFPGDIKLDGNLKNKDGSFWKGDIEIGTVVLQLPDGYIFSEAAIDIFDKFVAESNYGLTNAGFPAMRYADCSFVQREDLPLGKVRFNVSIQAFSPNIDGYDLDGYGIIVNDLIGVHMDHSSGVLRLSMSDLLTSEVYQTLVTKVQIIVYLKKSGWNNGILVIDPSQVLGLMV